MNTVRQLSVFIANRPGRLRAVTECLDKGKINMRALSVADTTDFGVLRLVVDKTDAAARLLEQYGFTVNISPVVAVEVPDRPGGLHSILGFLEEGSINIEYIYAFVGRIEGKALVLIKFNDPDKAIEVLQSRNVKVLSEQEVAAL
jgi:hypothetical protein